MNTLDFLTQLGNRFIVEGNFTAQNTYWGYMINTTKGKRLLSAIEEHKCGTASIRNQLIGSLIQENFRFN